MSSALHPQRHASAPLAARARDLAGAARELRGRAAHFDVLSDDGAPILTSIAATLQDLEGVLTTFGAQEALKRPHEDADAVAALRWHLTETARRARSARTGAEESARWARRLSQGGS